jgi:hypothetical protein
MVNKVQRWCGSEGKREYARMGDTDKEGLRYDKAD